MNSLTFWTILSTAYSASENGGSHGWFEALKKELARLSPDEILLFMREFEDRMDAAYKTDLWGAGYLINGGCSDDGFHYFRCWLVGMGKEVYEKALANPDSLADVLDGGWPCEASIDAAPARAWEEKTGRSDAEYYEELDKLGRHRVEVDEGPDWDFDDNDELRRRFPRLCRMYLLEPEA